MKLLKIRIYAVVLLTFVSFFLLCTDTEPLIQAPYMQAKLLSPQKKSSTKPFSTSEQSGQVYDLPWQGDSDFIKEQEAAGTFVLMAAYCTVLDDPLPGEEENVHHAVSLLKGIVVMPDSEFSQNRMLGPYTAYNGYKKGPTYSGDRLITTVGGGVCKVSSTLYNVSTLCDLKILERHPHSMPVPYVPYGQDATVSYGAKDFRFKNNTKFPILIWAKCIDTRLYIGFYGRKLPPKIEWHHQILKIIKASEIQRKNAELSPGTTKLLVKGMDGAIVKSWLTIVDDDNSIKVKSLGVDNYRPMPYLYEVN